MKPREVIRVIQSDHTRIQAIVARFAHGYDAANDLIQRGYLKLLQINPDTEIDCAYKYFITICRRLAYVDRRTLEASIFHVSPTFSKWEDLFITRESPETDMELEQLASQLTQALRGCSPRIRRVFEMAYIEGYIYSEIAKQFRVSESMVKKYLATAKQRIASERKLCARDVPPRSGGSKEARARIAKGSGTGSPMGKHT